MTPLALRDEERRDHLQVRALHEAAFGRPDEADIVDDLRPEALLSLVAEAGGEVVGHLVLTPARVAPQGEVLLLAPMAVLPQVQRAGIGSALVREALERTLGATVVVLGHPAYYPRFGFTPARDLRPPYDVPPEAWMAYGPGGLTGTVRFPAAFDRPPAR